jgi:hypothetical protein
VHFSIYGDQHNVDAKRHSDGHRPGTIDRWSALVGEESGPFKILRFAQNDGNLDSRESPLRGILSARNCPNRIPVAQKKTPLTVNFKPQPFAIAQVANSQISLGNDKNSTGNQRMLDIDETNAVRPFTGVSA